MPSSVSTMLYTTLYTRYTRVPCCAQHYTPCYTLGRAQVRHRAVVRVAALSTAFDTSESPEKPNRCRRTNNPSVNAPIPELWSTSKLKQPTAQENLLSGSVPSANSWSSEYPSPSSSVSSEDAPSNSPSLKSFSASKSKSASKSVQNH